VKFQLITSNGDKKRKGKKLTLGVALIGLSTLSSQVMAGTNELAVEEDMAEGIIAHQQPVTSSCAYDNENIAPAAFMAESVEVVDSQIIGKKYASDSSSPSVQDLMTEGICLETLTGQVAVK
jgi:hypothetical protein